MSPLRGWATGFLAYFNGSGATLGALPSATMVEAFGLETSLRTVVFSVLLPRSAR
jgi:hypothetical protein